MWEGGGRHMIGRFDGGKFIAQTGVLPSEWGANAYAAQTWNDVPDGRRLLIAWMRHRPRSGEPWAYQGMPFNQQMTFPRVLSLRSTSEGIRLFAEPAAEIAKLYRRQHNLKPGPLKPGENPLSAIRGELFDIESDLEVGGAASVELRILGTPIVYHAASRELSCLGRSVTLAEVDARLHLRVLVDRTSLEVFAAGGRYVMSFCFTPDPADGALALSVSGGAGGISFLRVRELNSAWTRAAR
jgi:sucrose-6-phosphate hydrolase SacC (GH32 family)